MKHLIILSFLFLSLKASAQVDSTTLPITIQITVRGILDYAYYMSINPNWSNRKAPDALVALVGSGTQLDSIVNNVTLTSGNLVNFVNLLIAERYGVIANEARSILSNLPVVNGYTGLISQIGTIASGNGAQKGAATYISGRYTAYNTALAAQLTASQIAGLTFIRN